MANSMLENLQFQKPIRAEDGSWDLGVWLDFRHLGAAGIQAFCAARQVAIDAGVPVFDSAAELAGAGFHSVFAAGHNTRFAQPGLLKDLLDLGQAWKGVYILLLACGDDQIALDTQTLIQTTSASGILAVRQHVKVQHVPLVLEALINPARQAGP